MEFEIQSHDLVLTAALSAHVEQRLRFSLSRFQEHVVRVSVCLAQVSGPGGTLDRRCHLQIHLHGHAGIVVEDTETELHVAVDRATERAGRTLGRQLRRAGTIFDNRSTVGTYEWNE